VVLDAAEGQYALLFRMAALLGLRRGELLGLRWDDLELDRRRLHVRQTYTNTGFGSPKSRAGRRVVPLTRGSSASCGHRLGASSNEHGLVFASSAGTPIDPRNLVTAWHRTLRKAGVRMLAFHSLRHTAVSLMIAHEGVNPKQLSAVIGHASIQLTYDTYGHLMPDAFEGLGARLDALSDRPSGGASRAAWGTVGSRGQIWRIRPDLGQKKTPPSARFSSSTPRARLELATLRLTDAPDRVRWGQNGVVARFSVS